MNAEFYLIFEVNHLQYGISSLVVQELFFLPEVTPVVEAPSAMIGVLNLRNEILPMFDLLSYLGQRSSPYQVTDCVIVVQIQEHRLGIIVDHVLEVQAIASEHISTSSLSQQYGEAESNGALLGLANINHSIVMLLNPAHFVHYLATEIPNPMTESAWVKSKNVENGSISTLAPNAGIILDALTPEDRQILRLRSEHLRHPLETEDSTGLIPLAVISLGGEFFGISLETVHEFTDIYRLTPVPCCPHFVLGNMNLRGEIITIVNISSVLNLSIDRGHSYPKAVVVRIEGIVAGMAVDDILDVFYVAPEMIRPSPVAIDSVYDEYLQGVVHYCGRVMGIINIAKILTAGVLMVDEDV